VTAVAYDYQPELDPRLFFEQALERLRGRIPNRVEVGHPEPTGGEAAWLDSMRERLRACGLPVQELPVQVDAWRDYVAAAGYHDRHAAYYKGNQVEKSLEHYLARLLLAPGKDTTFLDVGAEGAPLAEIFERLFDASSYRQDVMYAPGLNGRDIGSDMSRIPMPDGFFNAITATCALEHFEDEADILFIREVQRLLAPGGRVVVVPLYLHHRHAALTDPRHALAGGVRFDQDAVVYALDGRGNRHGRFYSPERLASRLVENAPELDFRVMILTNPGEVDPSVYCRFVLLGERRVEPASPCPQNHWHKERA